MPVNRYDNNMHDDGLLPGSLDLVTLLSSEQCSQFEQHCPVQDGLCKAG